MSDDPIHVYLVPVSGGEYQLYCEPGGGDDDDEPGAVDDGETRSFWRQPVQRFRAFWRRQIQRFRETLAEAEAERLRQERGEETDRRGIGRWVVGRIAEAIAEQRLLWQLRQAERVLLTHPDDLAGTAAEQIARTHLTADYGKHRKWCVIDGLLAAITGPLFFFVPGPNIIGWYFLFRAVGHLFALRGARQGLTAARWETYPSSPLASLRHALDLDGAERRHRLEAISEILGLNHLASFVERVAARTS